MTPKPHTREARARKHTVLAVSNDLHARIKQTKPPGSTMAAYVDALIEKALRKP